MPTKDEIYKKIDSLPEALRDAIYSESTLAATERTAEQNHLGEERTRKLAGIVGLCLAGFVHPEDLSREIATKLGIDVRVAEAVAKDIKLKILAPLATALAETHGYHMEGVTTPPRQAPVAPTSTPPVVSLDQSNTTTPTTPAVEAPQQDVPLKPRIQPEEVPTAPPASPFVLHEHAEAEATESAFGYVSGPTRPTFHIDRSFGADDYAEPLPAARLELGQQADTNIRIEPKTTRVGREEANIVHYSTPDAPVDPFAGTPKMLPPTPEQDNPPTTPKSSVPLDNVVNLKDLPR